MLTEWRSSRLKFSEICSLKHLLNFYWIKVGLLLKKQLSCQIWKILNQTKTNSFLVCFLKKHFPADLLKIFKRTRVLLNLQKEFPYSSGVCYAAFPRYIWIWNLLLSLDLMGLVSHETLGNADLIKAPYMR